MVGPALADRRDQLVAALVAMGGDPKGQGVLAGLGIESWEAVDHEEAEFMIDLMDTLASA